jgi:hypothetical protein
MNQISFRKILVAIIIIFIMAYSGRIMKFFSNLEMGDELSSSMQPLKDSPPEAKFVLMMLVFALVYISIFKLLQNRSSQKRIGNADRPQIYIVKINDNPKKDGGNHDNKQNKRNNREQNKRNNHEQND